MRFVIRDIRSRPRYFLRLVEKEVEGRNVRAFRGYKRETIQWIEAEEHGCSVLRLAKLQPASRGYDCLKFK